MPSAGQHTDAITPLITEAIRETFGFSAWEFGNEAEFKHELFFRLAGKAFGGHLLRDLEPGAVTPRLHAEGKVENGNPAKADILICDPFSRRRFNFKVNHVIELKGKLSHGALRTEQAKIATYRETYESIHVVGCSDLPGFSVTGVGSTSQAHNLVVGDRAHFGSSVARTSARADRFHALDAAAKVARQAIEESLAAYGASKDQYHSYYWCNYEHELARGHSFPCEGDFNAHLYARLRRALRDAVRIRSEYKPTGMPNCRVDLVLTHEEAGWAIPIEVKMNWDQYKPKYKNGKILPNEATTIVNRFAATAADFGDSRAMLVVIQGAWASKGAGAMRAAAEAIFRRSPVQFERVMFDEHAGRVCWDEFP